jgi:drug/metabolite transporter (DMT)-like permease
MMNIFMIMASNNALRHVPSTNVSVVGSTQAIYGAIFGALLLGESLTCQFILSGILVLSGIAVVIFSAPEPGQAEPGHPRSS